MEEEILEAQPKQKQNIKQQMEAKNNRLLCLRNYFLEADTGYAFLRQNKLVFVAGKSTHVDLVLYNHKYSFFLCVKLKNGNCTEKDTAAMKECIEYLNNSLGFHNKETMLGVIATISGDSVDFHYVHSEKFDYSSIPDSIYNPSAENVFKKDKAPVVVLTPSVPPTEKGFSKKLGEINYYLTQLPYDSLNRVLEFSKKELETQNKQ